MPLPKVHRNVVDQNGNIVPQVLCSVFNQGTGVLASLYQNDAGTVPLANPMTSDAQYGSIKFYVNPGHFDLTFTKPGYTFEPIYDMQVPADTVTLGSMATQDADAVAITGGLISGLTSLHGVANAQIAGSLGLAGGTPTTGYSVVASGASIASLPRIEMGTPARVGFDLTVSGSVHLVTGVLGVQTVTPGQSITTTGAIGLPGGTAGIVNTTSRAALKQAIRPLEGALATLLRLRERQWEWATDQPALAQLLPGTQTGFVVEELAEDRPQWVQTDGYGEQGYSEQGALALVVGALRELVARLEALEARRPAAGA